MKTLLAFILAFGLMAGNSNAHCGACGTDNDHNHATKTSKTDM